MIQIKNRRSDITGREYFEISDDKLCVAHCYFTTNSFTSDSKSVVIATFEDDGTTKPPCRYYVLDLESGKYEYLTSAKGWETGGVSCENKLYYSEGNKLRCTDIASKQTELIWEAPENKVFHGSASFTNDGRYLGVYWSENEQNSTFGVFDTKENKMHSAGEVSFMPPFTFADHGMICPTNKEIMFFAHEGSCFYVTDRLWLLDKKTGERRNLFKQRLTESGSNADCVGHESWKRDGSGVFFCKYAVSPEKPTGIHFCDLDGNVKCINSEAAHWHAAADSQGVYVVSDTGPMGLESDIMLTDTRTGNAVILEHVNRWANHPGHPHPSFSPDCSKVIYAFRKEDGNLAVAVMDINDIRN